jgi:hypothetical protein
MSSRWRRAGFASLALLCVAAGASYTAWAVIRSESAMEGATARASGESVIRSDADALLFRNVQEGDEFGRLAVAPLTAPERGARVMELACDRLYWAGGRGLCLTSRLAFANAYRAKIFDARLEITGEVRLGGVPSRARVSSDGRYGAATTFVTGHSYADASEFSTETVIIDMARGRSLGSLEGFGVLRGGEPFRRVDFNFWGVTFAQDSDRFYATLATGGETYLVVGSVRERRVTLLRRNVECPSLSPDGKRLAFKKRMGDGPDWQLAVLDLVTMEERLLPGTRGLDDQAEWLDDRRIVFGWRNDVVVVPANGDAGPRVVLHGATSPSVLRG